MINRYKQLSRNLDEVNRLSKPVIPADASDEQIIQAIRSNTQRIGQLRHENNALLDELIYCRHPEDMSRQDAEDLFAFVSSMCCTGHRIFSAGISYRAHLLLDAYARLHHDDDIHIAQTTYLGIALHCMSIRCEGAGLNLFGRRSHDCFAEGASFFPRLAEFSNCNTRKAIFSGLINQKIGLECLPDHSGNVVDLYQIYDEYNRLFHQAEAVFADPEMQAQNPDIRLDRMLYTLHYDRTKFIPKLWEHPEPQLMQDLHRSAEFVRSFQIERGGCASAEVEGQYLQMEYFIGHLTLPQLQQKLMELLGQSDMDCFNERGIMANILLPVRLLQNFGHMPPELRRQYDPQIHRITRHCFDYLCRIPRNEYADFLSESVLMLAEQDMSLEPDFARQLLNFLMACHLPSYIHSLMVGRLSSILMNRVIATFPEALIGVLGCETVAEVLERQEELKRHAFTCGLYHDVGKTAMLGRIGDYGRRLVDEEYIAIQQHTRIGAYLLERCGVHEDLIHCARFHHQFHDGCGGYPRQTAALPDSTRLLIGIVAVADSLDAATDDIGRGYHAAKTVDQLIDELRAERGTRYHPVIVDLFRSQQNVDEARTHISLLRQRIYCTAYHAADSDRISLVEQLTP